MKKPKILCLSSSPDNLAKLEVDEEFRKIYESTNKDFFEIESESETKIVDLQAVIIKHQPDIIHFSGHGSSEDMILETVEKTSVGVFKQSFIRIFKNLNKKPELIFLNACKTYENLEDLSYEIDFVIATDRKVSDMTAIKFAQHFYKYLSLEASIKSSFNLAKNQFDIEKQIHEAKIYRLLVREGARNDRIFSHSSPDNFLKQDIASSNDKTQERSEPASNNKNNSVVNKKSKIGRQTNIQGRDNQTVTYHEK